MLCEYVFHFSFCMKLGLGIFGLSFVGGLEVRNCYVLVRYVMSVQFCFKLGGGFSDLWMFGARLGNPGFGIGSHFV